MSETTETGSGRKRSAAAKRGAVGTKRKQPSSGAATTRGPAKRSSNSTARRAATPVRKKTAAAPGAGTEKTRSMSAEHKSAIQNGRAQTRIVREYLDALESRRPRRGPRPDPTKMRGRIGAIDAELATAEPLERVTLHQERMDLERQIEALEQGDRFDELEEGFVSVAGEYSKRRGISAEAWLAVGVPKAVVKRAGIA